MARNIRIITTTAEQYVADLNSRAESIGPIDLIYIDPARRDSQGKKVWLLEDCSPNVTKLLPSLLQLSPLVVIKASPLFDIDEAFRLFGEKCSVEIISVHGECKEVLIEIRNSQKNSTVVPSDSLPSTDNLSATGNLSTRSETPQTPVNVITDSAQMGVIRLTASGHPSLCYSHKEEKWLSPPQEKTEQQTSKQNPFPEQNQDHSAQISAIQQDTLLFSREKTDGIATRYLLIPDVVLYKARLIEQYAQYCGCRANSATGYLFSDHIPQSFVGHIYPIQWATPYKPKALKSQFKKDGITRCNLLKKDFPQDAETIAKSLGIRQGGTHYAAFTRIGTQPYVLMLGDEIFIQNPDLDQHEQPHKP